MAAPRSIHARRVQRGHADSARVYWWGANRYPSLRLVEVGEAGRGLREGRPGAGGTHTEQREG